MFRMSVAVMCLTAVLSWADNLKPMTPPQPPGTGHPPGKTPEPTAEKTFTVNFQAMTWEEVFAWYAKETGLKASVKVEPKGEFTYNSKDRKLTAGEIIDILNEELAKQKLYMTRGHRAFVVVSDPAKIDPKFVPALELKDLATRGRTELVEVAIPLGAPGWAEFDEITKELIDELSKLLTPMGKILSAEGKWIVVRDTVGNVERFRAALQTCNVCPAEIRPVKPGARVTGLRMKDEAWEDVFEVYEKLSGLKGDIKSKPKGTFTFEPAKRDQRFTLGEITDAINEELAKQKRILIRRHMTFVVVSTAEKIDPTLIPRIELSQLSERGSTELVQVILSVCGMAAEDVFGVVKKLSGPSGHILPHKSFLIISDTAFNVSRIKRIVEELNDPKPEEN